MFLFDKRDIENWSAHGFLPPLQGLNEFLWPTQAKAWARFSWPFGPLSALSDFAHPLASSEDRSSCGGRIVGGNVVGQAGVPGVRNSGSFFLR